MKALILAGGLGTRLRSYIPDRPKSMAVANGKPFLEYQITQLRAQGFKEFILCVGHLAHQIQDYFGDGRPWEVQISYAVETELLGTAGAIKNARRFIDGTILVLNGDSYLEFNFDVLIAFHRRKRSADRRAVGTVATVTAHDSLAYGTLELNARDQILYFREKANAGPGWISAGVYVLEPEILNCIPGGRMVSIEKETFPLVLERGRHLYGYRANSFFVDIGTPQGCRRFCKYAEEQRL